MPDPRTGRGVLAEGRQRLEAGGIEDAVLEAEVLLRAAMGGEEPVSRAHLYQRLAEPLDVVSAGRFEAFLLRRLSHEPSAYITGHREFYGLDFIVSPDVLIPRPETELLVDTAAKAISGVTRRQPAVADIGTGSGAIAVALATRVPSAVVYATDASMAALAIARSNARRHGVESRIAFRHGDLLLPLDSRVDVIAANLPYVTTDDWRGLSPELREHEPRLALDGGQDGLDLVRALLRQAPRYLRAGGVVCLEFGVGQRDAIVEAARSAIPKATTNVIDDFAGIPRVLVVQT